MSTRRGRVLRQLLRTLTILASIVLLLAAAGGAYLSLLHAKASVETYRPPIGVQPRPAGQQTAPLASQVVLVLIDGLRYDAVADMPTLSLLQREGASARAVARAPAYSVPTWATLVTGAWPELNGAPLLCDSESCLGPIPSDHIFGAAKRAGLTTALVGSSWWDSLIPRDFLDAHFFVEGFDATADQQAADTALRFVRNFEPNLLLVYFGQIDEVAHRAGATGDLYREAALEVDDHLRNVVEGLDLQHSVLIVVSDHGHIDRGGHGGSEPEVVVTPFVAVGDPIIPGDYGTIAQADVAPTVTAILGAPAPRLSQGLIRFEMLRSDEVKQAETQAEAALQRQDYANLYLHSIGHGSLSDTAQGDVDVAISSLEVRNLKSAYRLAGIAVDRIDQEVARARQRRIQRERRLRLPLAAALVGLPLAFLVLRGSRRGLWLLLSAGAALLAYHGLFLWQNGAYSLSGIWELRVFAEQIARQTLVALGLGGTLVLWRLIRDGEGSVLEVVQTGLGYSLWVIYLLACQVAVAYWLNGLRFTWYVPDLGVAFWQLVALIQIPVVAAAGLVLPIVLLLAGVAYQGVSAMNRRVRAPIGGR